MNRVTEPWLAEAAEKMGFEVVWFDGTHANSEFCSYLESERKVEGAREEKMCR